MHIHATRTLIVSTLLVIIPVSVEVVMLGMENLVQVCTLYFFFCIIYQLRSYKGLINQEIR